MRPPLLGRIAFGLSLLAFPRAFRRRYGDELGAFLSDHHAHARRAGRTGMGFWLKACGSLVWNGWLVRMGADPLTPPAMGRRETSAPRGGGNKGPGSPGRGSVRELRLIFRGLLRAGGYTFTTVFTLALAIAASTVIFSVLQPVLLAPLPYPDGDRVVVLSEMGPGPGSREEWVSPLTFRDWRERSQVFDDLVSYRLALLTWTGGEAPRLLRGWAVSAGYFSLMGVEMTLGRGFSAEEDIPGSGQVVVLSHGFWSRAFGSDPAILGRSLMLDGRPHTVVGVAGPELDFPSPGEYWVPAATDFAQEFRDFRYLGVIGRIRPGFGVADAEAEMARISGAIAEENPATNQGWGVAMTPLREVQVGGVRPVLVGMAFAVLLLFLIALGNVANLTLVRGMGRRVDSAIRRALGAGRRALARTFVIEGLVLGTAGAGLGLLMAWAGLHWLRSTSLLDLPRVGVISLSTSGALLALGIALGVGGLLGAVSLGASKPKGLAEALRAGSGGGLGTGRAHRVREAVLVAQVAMALTLLIGASLLTRSLLNLNRVDPGFEPRELLAFGFNLPRERYTSPEAIRTFENQTLSRLEALPGVEAVAVATPLPMEMGSVPSSWSLPPDARDPSMGPVMAHMRVVSQDYNKAMELELLSGRFFDSGDKADAEGVVLVNRAFVERYLAGTDPLGQRVTAGEPDAGDEDWATIVGVVENVRFRSLRSGAEPEIYLPTTQLPTSWGHLVIRSGLQREALIRMVTGAVSGVDGDLALSDIVSGAEIIGGQLRTARLSTLLTAIFALTASILAIVGILGVLSIVVAQRVREIGLRKALGATAGSIRGFVLLKGLRPVGMGLALGTGVAVAGTRILGSQLYGVEALDPVGFVLSVVGFLAAAVLVSLIPGARATSVSPVDLLTERR